MSLAEPIAEEEYRFHFLAGRLCLDLVATVGERWRRSFERLREPADLTRWLGDCSLALPELPVTPEELEATRELREAVNRIARGRAAGHDAPPGDLAIVNAAAAHPDLVPQLPPGWRAPLSVSAALSTIARDAIALLSGPQADRIRECARPDCALLFVDASRPGTRRWCSMGGCGNRTKTAAYRRRRAAHDEKGERA
jgi:predicted RNA-binding Zn ribbon-like protein